MRRAMWRLLSHKSVSLVGAPLLAEYSIVRLFHHYKWDFEVASRIVPVRALPVVTSSMSFWRTVLLIAFVKSLGNLVLGVVNRMLDYSRYVVNVLDLEDQGEEQAVE